jgi:hypothetical protein
MQKTADYMRTNSVDIVWGPRVRETYSRAEICDPNGFHISVSTSARGGEQASTLNVIDTKFRMYVIHLTRDWVVGRIRNACHKLHSTPEAN